MKLNWIFAIVTCLAAAIVTGCVNTVDGRTRGGIPFQKDRIEGRYERPPSDLLIAAKDVLKYHGTLTSEDAIRSSIQGNVDERQIWVMVEPVDNKISRVVVQARKKSGFADLELAAYLEKEIAVRLATGNLNPASAVPGR